MIYIVGKLSVDFRNYLNDHHVPYGLLLPTGTATPAGIPTSFLNFDSQEALQASLGYLPPPDISGVLVTGYEQYVLPAASIAQELGLPGLSIDAAQAATDKIIMRQRFTEYDPSITPQFSQVTSWQDIEQFIHTHAFPVMLKPANLMKSLFITRNQSLDELRHNYKTALTELPKIYQKHGVGEPRLLVEECMAGSMHTVAGFVDTAGNISLLDDIVDCATAQDIGKADNYLFARLLPTSLSHKQQQALLMVARKGVLALGLRATPLHIELMLTPNGPKIIEIGARLGGYRPRMYQAGLGIDMYRAAIDVAMGLSAVTTATTARACTVLELFAGESGNFVAVEHLDQLRSLTSLSYMRIHARQGAPTGRAADGFRAAVVVILEHHDTLQLQKDIDWIRRNVIVRVAV